MFYEQFRQLVREAHFPILEWGDSAFDYTTAMVQQLRALPYADQWRLALESRWFHLRLEDQSLMTFSTYGGRPSYHFMDRPIDVPSIRDFVVGHGHIYNAASRARLLEAYAEAMATSGFRRHITPVRYDHDVTGYRAGVHPVAHIHVGLDNQIRLGVKREMTPTSFLLFVMRQLYPECWERLLEKREGFRLRKRVRDDLVELVAPHFEELDEDCIYLV